MYEQRYEGHRQLVWSQKSTTALFHPFSGPIPTADLDELRATLLDVKARTSLCSVAVGYQLADETDDESSWGSTTQLSASAATADGETYEDTFTDVSSSMTKRYIRFGYMVLNTTTSTTVQAAQVAAVVDCR